jgi:hypothetical protein
LGASLIAALKWSSALKHGLAPFGRLAKSSQDLIAPDRPPPAVTA